MRPTVTSDASSSSMTNNVTTALVEQNCVDKCDIDGSMLVNLTDCPRAVTCTVSDCQLYCAPLFQFNAGDEGALFTLGNVISLLLLLATIVTYIYFGELRKGSSGKYLLHLIGALFMAKFAFQINPLFIDHTTACSVMAIFQHYFCLAAFLWTNIISFNLWRDTKRSPAEWSSSNINLMHPLYVCYAWGLPFSVVVACSVVEFLDNRMRFKYGNSEHCGVLGDDALVYSLAVPLVFITLSNIGLFMLIVYKPHMRKRLFPRRKKRSAAAQAEEDVLYERSSSIMQPVEDSSVSGSGRQYGSTTSDPTNDRTNNATHRNQDFAPTTSITTAQSITSTSNINSSSSSSSAYIETMETRTANPGHLYSDTRGTTNRNVITTSTLPASTRTRTLSPQEEALRAIHDELAQQVWIYAKMAILMSFAWLAGFLAVLTQTVYLWIAFVILNAMQGIFVFFSFTLSPPASDLWKKHWRVVRKKWNRRDRYRKFEAYYSARGRGSLRSRGQGAGEEEPTAVIMPAVSESTA